VFGTAHHWRRRLLAEPAPVRCDAAGCLPWGVGQSDVVKVHEVYERSATEQWYQTAPRMRFWPAGGPESRS
jgi:hypothetical protein